MEENYFEVVNNEGEKILCKKLLDFSYNNKFYILYTDFEQDDNLDLEVLASSYEIINGNLKLNPLETEEEWKIVNNKWKEFKNV